MTDTESATTVTEEKLLEVEEQIREQLGKDFSQLTEEQKEQLLERIRAKAFTPGATEGSPEALIDETAGNLVAALLEAISATEGVSIDDYNEEELDELIEAALARE